MLSISLFGLPCSTDSKESACNAKDPVRSPGREDPLEKGMATHSSIIAWRIPWTKGPGTRWATVHGVAKSETTERLTLVEITRLVKNPN